MKKGYVTLLEKLNIDMVKEGDIDDYELSDSNNEKYKEEINNVLKTLTEREEQVLRLRYGLVDGKQHTLEEVGKVFGVTRERIRQIESKALRGLRHRTRQRRLSQYRND